MAELGEASAIGAVLDAHYYDSGLKVRRIAATGVGDTLQRLPSERVGYGDEVPLGPDDWLVEIARLRSEDRHLTWIAIYRSSIDATLGPRSNYQGVGIWLIDATSRRPDLLLAGLREVVTELVAKGLDRCETVARDFATPKHLFLAPLAPMPAGLDGWPFSADLMPLTVTYQTGGSVDPWAQVAEQVSRMTVLPGPTPAHARCLILVPTSPVHNVEAVPRGLANDLLAALQPAFADTATAMLAARQEGSASRTEAADLRTRLNEAESAGSEARATVARLQRQIDEDDDRKRHQAISDQLARIQESTRRVELALPDLKRAAADRTVERWTPDGSRSGPTQAHRAPSSGSWEPHLIGASVMLFLIGFAVVIYVMIERWA